MGTDIREQALTLRLQGLSFREVAERLGVSPSRVVQITRPHPAIRKQVAARANYCCEMCGIQLNMGGQAHHKTVSEADPEAYNDVDNLMYLCMSCHRRVHNNAAFNKQKNGKQVGFTQTVTRLVRTECDESKPNFCTLCGKTWASRTENPLACPKCKRYDWRGEPLTPRAQQKGSEGGKCSGCGRPMAKGFHDIEPNTCNYCGRQNN